MSLKSAEITAKQRDFLLLAARSTTGNPWPNIGIRQRAGGAMSRMFDGMKAKGWFGPDNCITGVGLDVLREAQRGRTASQ